MATILSPGQESVAQISSVRLSLKRHYHDFFVCQTFFLNLPALPKIPLPQFGKRLFEACRVVHIQAFLAAIDLPQQPAQNLTRTNLDKDLSAR